MNSISLFDASKLTEVFCKLKKHFQTDKINPEREKFIRDHVQKYGYLRYTHQQALEELSTAETLIGLEEKFKLNNIYKDEQFTFTADNLSPVQRAGYNDSSWIRKEQLNVKLINLAALGNGNNNLSNAGKFEDWIKQILIAPSGNLDFGVLGTVLYLVPFHPRDFGCAYLPRSSAISESLEDTALSEKFNLKVDHQVKLFLTLCQLAGHPTMYDVLPQTSRYASIVLAKPFVARWFDIKELNNKLEKDIDKIEKELAKSEDPDMVKTIACVLKDSLQGSSENVPVEGSYIEEKFELMLDIDRKKHSEEMTKKENQEALAQRVKKLITEELNLSVNTDLTEENIGDNRDRIVGKLIEEGLWPSPGGAWCSSGIPVYKRMVSGGGFPLFDHFDVDGKDVTVFANLDCQTPFYFVYLENGQYNLPVIDFWCDYLVKIQQEYNFDSFRVDHIDHIVDRVSQTKDGRPISYRAPAKVLSEANRKLREAKPHFGLLAEYMLWERFYKEYHQQMGFDILWGADIVNQFMKNVQTILKDSGELKEYNDIFGANQTFLSILKAYNNQDGEFREIDQYPAQNGEEGALFKWFKLKFLPLTPLAERPVMFIDGDESFTKTGVERVIGSEVSLRRENNMEFFRKFDAINNFAINNIFCRYSVAEVNQTGNEDDGLIAWSIKKQPEFGDDERLFIVANEHPPQEVIREENSYNQLISIPKTYESVKDAQIFIPEGFIVCAEYILQEGAKDFIEAPEIKNLKDCTLVYDELKPAEFHVYRIKRPV